MEILAILAPGLLGGGIGSVLGVLRTPGAGLVIKAGKQLAKGTHLNEKERKFIRAYNQKNGQGPGGHPAAILHRWR